MRGRLTTHVLDTVRGRPAEGVTIELRAGEETLKTVRTNADGRTDEPLLAGESLSAREYEIVFHVGDYFAAAGLAADGVPFLDRVPVRFGVSDPEAHYHVPLLVSPWSYSTYRGS